jgi:hypothetical protein
MQQMVSTALKVELTTLAPFAAAQRSRSRAAFSAAVARLFEQLPRTIFKHDGQEKEKPREAVYHASLFSALKATEQSGVNVQIQSASMRGVADIVVHFSGAPHAAAWVIEIGIGKDAAAKLPQAQDYAQALGVADVFCCAIVVNEDVKSASVKAGGAALSVAWSQRVGSAWVPRLV